MNFLRDYLSIFKIQTSSSLIYILYIVYRMKWVKFYIPSERIKEHFIGFLNYEVFFSKRVLNIYEREFRNEERLVYRTCLIILSSVEFCHNQCEGLLHLRVLYLRSVISLLRDRDESKRERGDSMQIEFNLFALHAALS